MADLSCENNTSSKIRKLDNNTPSTTDSIHNNLLDLSDFKSERILSNNTSRKTICLKGTFTGKDGVGIVLLEKSAFVENDLINENKYFSTDCYLKKDFSNDIYGNYVFYPKVELNGIKTTIIHPATDNHIIKFSSQKVHLIDETYDIYKNIILPYLEKEAFSLQWIFNILDHTKEQERIVFEDPDPEVGFILLPDLKWDGKTLGTLYLLAIVHKKGIKSLRDLTAEHLPLLKNIFEKGSEAIESKYGFKKNQLRIYIHYQPSFYHLHVHFTYLKHEAPGIFTEKSHMLSNVISNISLLPNYYQLVTIPFIVAETGRLFETLVSNKILEPIEKNIDN